ncbi:ras oncogene family protein, putative, partial [Ichthyophthirius multifiliis]
MYAGQQSFRQIVKSFYKNAIAVLVVYDITDVNSFQLLQNWIDEIKCNSHQDIIIGIIGNKLDMNE